MIYGGEVRKSRSNLAEVWILGTRPRMTLSGASERLALDALQRGLKPPDAIRGFRDALAIELHDMLR